eukprot:scaffold731_cov328-Prasinococcus_capsulatus_cf.AAC.8
MRRDAMRCDAAHGPARPPSGRACACASEEPAGWARGAAPQGEAGVGRRATRRDASPPSIHPSNHPRGRRGSSSSSMMQQHAAP